MFYKINIILVLLFLYLIFFNYFVINNLIDLNSNRKPLLIKFIIYNESMIKTEVLRNRNENFTDFLMPVNEQLNRFNSEEQAPIYCNNIDCNFPVFQIVTYAFK